VLNILSAALLFIVIDVQCFNAVVWAAGKTSGLLKKLSGGMLAWLCLGEVQLRTWPS